MSSPTVDWTRPETLYTILCRPALPKDTPGMMELTRTIWDGEDYVPHVWAEWLVDYQGLLAVAEYGPHVVGLGKLTRLGAGEWWMEGLRVHPQYEGQGIASRLHEYLLSHWQLQGEGVLRLSTASFRKPVHHLCERTGFQKITELTIYRALALPEAAASMPLTLEDVDSAYRLAMASETFPLTTGLLDLGWQWAQVSVERIVQAVQRGRAWWWRDRAGLLLARDVDDEDGFSAQLIACARADLAGVLGDFRCQAAAAGYARAEWLAPLEPGVETALQSAGFQREWDASIYIYEKQRSPGP